MEKRQCGVKYETMIFGRRAESYGFGGREGERGVDYFRGLVRETDEKEFSFREIVDSWRFYYNIICILLKHQGLDTH